MGVIINVFQVLSLIAISLLVERFIWTDEKCLEMKNGFYRAVLRCPVEPG